MKKKISIMLFAILVILTVGSVAIAADKTRITLLPMDPAWSKLKFNIIPDADSTYTLGDSTHYWLSTYSDNIYAYTITAADGTGISIVPQSGTGGIHVDNTGNLNLRSGSAPQFFATPLDPKARILEEDSTNHGNFVLNGGDGPLSVKIGSTYYYITADESFNLTSTLDTGSVAVGTNYYVYAVPEGTSYTIKTSTSSSTPSGYTATTHSTKLGGFHTLCANVGTIAGHALTDYLAGEILPKSIWCLRHRPRSGAQGMVWSESANIWVDIYLASGTGASTASAYSGTISDNRDWMNFVDDFAAVNKQLLSDDEFQIIAANSNEGTNILGSADPVKTGGHSDTAGRRMISDIGVEDACGAVWQWLRDQSYRFDGGTIGLSAASATIGLSHAAAPAGNLVYVKRDAGGNPYLACNMATDTADKILTFGSAYTVLIKHETAASASSYTLYFDEDATQPSRLLAAMPGLKDVYIPTSNPQRFLKITYNAAPGTPGVAVTYDDGADERLEFTSPTAANGTLDLALLSFSDPSWSYQSLAPKGHLYKQGTYGDVKLLAGGAWNNGAFCGSRARYAYDYRWHTNSYIGGRGRSLPK